MRQGLFTLAAAVSTSAAMAQDIVRVETDHSVSDAADKLVAAVEGAGAKVMARVDHGAGAQSVGADIGGSQLVIFGNPAIGTPAMQDARLAGLYLPLKVLVYEDEAGQVWLAYEAPSATLTKVDGIPADAAYIAKMTGALGKLTAKAAE